MAAIDKHVFTVQADQVIVFVAEHTGPFTVGDHDIVAGSAVHICKFISDQSIVPRSAVQKCVIATMDQEIIAIIAEQGLFGSDLGLQKIITIAAFGPRLFAGDCDGVTAIAAICLIFVAVAADEIIATVTVDDVVRPKSDQAVIIIPAINQV